MKKVSVIIPVYNVEKYVDDCLDSVRAQTLREIEVICIHDGGTDHSFESVRRAASVDSRIVCLENDCNLGLAATRNRGLDLARGEYVYFLDSDDMIRPDALESLYRQAVHEQLDAIVFEAEALYETRELEARFQRDRFRFRRSWPDVMQGKELFIQWMHPWEWMPSQPRYFYRRSFLEEASIRFIDGMLHEDELFAFEVCMKAERIRVVREPYFIRRFREHSIMSSGPSMKNVESCLEILKTAGAFESSDEALNRAVHFYLYKLFRDTVKKYQTVRNSGQSVEWSAAVRMDPAKKALAAVTESFALWGEPIA